jgi:hypothetical protein
MREAWGMSKLTKAQEKRFDEKFLDEYGFWNVNNVYRDGGKIHAGRIKQHLAKELAIQKKEIYEDIEKMGRSDSSKEYNAGEENTFNRILNKLK